MRRWHIELEGSVFSWMLTTIAGPIASHSRMTRVADESSTLAGTCWLPEGLYQPSSAMFRHTSVRPSQYTSTSPGRRSVLSGTPSRSLSENRDASDTSVLGLSSQFSGSSDADGPP